MTEIRERDFRAFFAAPFECYPEDSPYVSPLKSDLQRYLSVDANPLFERDDQFTYFTAHRGGKVLGRIVAHVHEASNKLHGLNRACFGYFDCADDSEAASALLSAAERWARMRGYDEIAGNFNLTIAQQIGVLTGGFSHAPYTDMAYNPPHVPALLERNGYQPFFPMTAFEDALADTDPDDILGPKQKEILADPDFVWMPIDKSTLPARLSDAPAVLNDAFRHNPMFVPVTRAEFDFQTADMNLIIDPRISVVLHYQGRPAGAVICIPDLNPLLRGIKSRMGVTAPFHFLRHRFHRKRAVIIYYAVIRELHGRGVNGAMLYKTITALKSAGYEWLGGTWIFDGNPASLRQKEKLGSHPIHRLSLYRKAVSDKPLGPVEEAVTHVA